MRKQQGFTLIELLIVLAILGILIGIVAMSVGGLNQTAKSRGMNSEKEIVQTAIDTYNTQDVTVEGSATIPARATAATIGTADTDAPFAKYLKRATKYKYTWAAGGDTLVVSE
jgi:prepilin-type N-terminal cleavage/methylation domain-containing protein